MKRLLLTVALISTVLLGFGQTKKYNTSFMNYQQYTNGVPSGSPSITSRNDTITISPKSILITNFVYGSNKTSTFKVTSVSNNIYTCQVDDFESYKVYIKEAFVIVERYAGKDLFVIRKYLIEPD